MVSIFNRNIINPLSNDFNASQSLIETPLKTDIEENVTTLPLLNASLNNSNYDIISTVFSLFILWIAALIGGRIFAYLRLPPLLGKKKKFLKICKIFRNVISRYIFYKIDIFIQ